VVPVESVGPGPEGDVDERDRVVNVVGTLLVTDALREVEGVGWPPLPLSPPGADEDCTKLMIEEDCAKVVIEDCVLEMVLDAVCVLNVTTGGFPLPDPVVDEGPELPEGVGSSLSSSSQSSSPPGVGVAPGTPGVLESLVTALMGTVGEVAVLVVLVGVMVGI
jgi:hypothetical protein